MLTFNAGSSCNTAYIQVLPAVPAQGQAFPGVRPPQMLYTHSGTPGHKVRNTDMLGT